MIHCVRTPAAFLFVGVAVSACGSTGGTYSVHQGNYSVYDCAQLQVVIKNQSANVQEFQELMARADKGPGGAFVNLIAYRTEYDQAAARLNEARAEAGRKGCGLQGPASSDRSMY